MITIVGMGPGSESFLTMDAFKTLTSGQTVYLRTDRHPVVPYLVEQGMCYQSFDDYYHQFESFDEVYEAIANEIIALAEHDDILYAVPGNPFVAEKTVSIILERYKIEENLSESDKFRIVHGTSFIDAIVTALKYDPVNGFVILDALNVEHEWMNATKDHLFIQVYDQMSASHLKLALMDVWEDEHLVTIIRGAGIPCQEMIKTVPLCELDHTPDDFNHLTSLFVPGGKSIRHELRELEDVIAILRGENGCPWDREQTHESLASNLIEEAYEVKDAIVKGHEENLIEELGDVLLQVVFHASIASDDGYFDMNDVIRGICEKMIRRHPHVFGSVDVKDSEEVLANWQMIKDEEKALTSIAESMKSVTYSLPSLMRAQKVQKKAAAVGFDWDSPLDAVEKIHEELKEWEIAIQENREDEIKEELGDLLLIISNVARLLKIDAEQALVDAIEKFVNRFSYIEENLKKMNKTPNILIREEMNVLWSESKKSK